MVEAHRLPPAGSNQVPQTSVDGKMLGHGERGPNRDAGYIFVDVIRIGLGTLSEMSLLDVSLEFDPVPGAGLPSKA